MADMLKVQHYAESNDTCRHVAICRYFGEKIDAEDKVVRKAYCDNLCDVSSITRGHTEVDGMAGVL